MQTNIDKKSRLIADIVLIVLLLAVGLSAIFILRAVRGDGSAAVVSVDGEEVARYRLDTDGRYELNGGTNILVIEDGFAYIDYADCPDGTCKRTGKISMEGDRIICLPNRVIVEIRQ